MEVIPQGFTGPLVEAVAGFDGKKAPARVDQKSRAANAVLLAGHAFHREGVELASSVPDLCRAAAQQPQPPGLIHFPGVARSVPDFAFRGELGFLVSAPVKIALF